LNPRDPELQPGGWAGPGVLVAGVLLILAAQALAPVAAPLFDSLTVLGPYHYLSPTGNQVGAPTSATVTDPLVGGLSPGFNAATTESPPQAQLIASAGAFQLAPGTTSVTVAIAPVAPPAPSTVGAILGNVYHYTVTDQDGVALSTKPGTDVTLVLRAPDATSDAVVAQFSGGTWTQISSSPSGTPAFFIGTATTFGDFALVAVAGSGIGPLQVSLLVLFGLAIVVLIGFVLVRRRRSPEPRLTPTAPATPRPRPTAGSTNRRKRKRR
jgi:LPXTG-motif cell wall-anchored protein